MYAQKSTLDKSRRKNLLLTKVCTKYIENKIMYYIYSGQKCAQKSIEYKSVRKTL